MSKLLILVGVTLVLREEVASLLDNVPDVVNYVAVIGPVCSGKSFLCNSIATCYERQFLGINNATVSVFRSSNQREPVTDGVDLYRCSKSNFFLGDVEGLGMRDTNLERNLMATTMIAANSLVFNVKGPRPPNKDILEALMRIRSTAIFAFPPADDVADTLPDGATNMNAIFGHLIVVIRDVQADDLKEESVGIQQMLFGKNQRDGDDMESMRNELRRSFASLSVHCLPPAADMTRSYNSADFNFTLAAEDFRAAVQDLVRLIHSKQAEPRRIHGSFLTGPFLHRLLRTTVAGLNSSEFLLTPNMVGELERRIVEQLADDAINNFRATCDRIEGLYDPATFNGLVVRELTRDLHAFQIRVTHNSAIYREAAETRVRSAFNLSCEARVSANRMAVNAVLEEMSEQVFLEFSEPFRNYFIVNWQNQPVGVTDTPDAITAKYNTDLEIALRMWRERLAVRGIESTWPVFSTAREILSVRAQTVRAEVYEQFGELHDQAVAAALEAARNQRDREFVGRMAQLMTNRREEWRRNLAGADLSLRTIASEVLRQDGLGAYFEALRVRDVLDILEREVLSMSYEALYADLLNAVRACEGKFVPHPQTRELSMEVARIEARPVEEQNQDRLAELKRQLASLEGTRLSDGAFLQMKTRLVERMERPDFFSMQCPCPGWRGQNERRVWRLEGYTVGRVFALMWNLMRQHNYRVDGVVTFIDQMNESLTTNNGGEWCANGHTAHAIASLHGLLDLPDLQVETFNVDTLLHIAKRTYQSSVLERALKAGEEYMRGCGQVRDTIELFIEHLRTYLIDERGP